MAVFSAIRRLVNLTIGGVSWQAPPWLAWLARRLGSLRAHPLRAGGLLLLLAMVAAGGWQGWRWWESHRPRTFAYQNVRQATARIPNAPGLVSPGAPNKDLVPQPLKIDFGGVSVAPLEMIGKEAGGVARLDPELPGKWIWRDGSVLEFQPDGHWPPGVDFKVRLRPSALGPDLRLDSKVIRWKSPPMVAELRDCAFYNSPKDPKIYQVVATLCLSHPVDPASLEEKLRLQVIGGTQLFTPGVPLFSVAADPLSSRRYFIRSRQIVVPLKEDWVKFTVPAGLRSMLGGSPLATEVLSKTRVPDKRSGLRIESVRTAIVRNDEGQPQQMLFVSTNMDIASAEITRRIGMWWRLFGWYDADGRSRFKEHSSSANRVALIPIEGAAPLSKEHAFRFVQTPTNGSLFVHIDEGVESPGGFVIPLAYEKELQVPQFPKETRLLGEGNVLVLNGDRKLLVESRGIRHLRITLKRVPVAQLASMVALTRSRPFEAPMMEYGEVTEENFTQRWSQVVEVPNANDWDAARTEIDMALAPPLTQPEALPGGRGVFFISVEPVAKLAPASTPNDVHSRIEGPFDAMPNYTMGHWYGYERYQPDDGWTRADGTISKRFVMVTDLGLLVKTAADSSRDVFVMNLSSGSPADAVDLKVMARNGNVLESVRTDTYGHARLPAIESYKGERLPVALLASKDGDVSFLPFNEHQLPAMDYSRFDIDGVMASRIKALEAFIFTERGVYRPGDTVHAGIMTRRRDWHPVLEGLPLAISLADPRGREVGQQKIRLGFDGFLTCDFPLTEGAALGVHELTVNVLDRSGSVAFRLGRCPIRVEEFQPDRMKVATQLDPPAPTGWLDCKAVAAKVSVRSLFDEAAPERRVTMRLELSPTGFGFPEWPNYTFYDRNAANSESRAGRSIDLGESKTDAAGVASFRLPLDTLKDASFRMAVLTEAFERDGGRSVRHAMTCLVSPHESVVGWKADGDLTTTAKDSGRSVKLVALARDLKPVALANLRMRQVEIRQVSVLTRIDNGDYAYQSTAKEQVLSESPFALAATPTEYPLPTGKAGRFRMEMVDSEGTVHCAVPYEIVGKGNDQALVARDAELSLRLSQNEVLPGAEVDVFLTAPYAGAGVVTMERDQVITSHWFKTGTKDMSLRMKIPDDAEGTYYINAAFVRSPSAAEVFHSPLSYAAAPIRVKAPRKELALRLDSPREMRPGTDLRMGISADHAARAVVYAVDEGIHQITGYQRPRPLDYFLRKQALEVRTQQWLDLLLPEYRFLKSPSAFGGDGDGDEALSLHLNPFKRRKEPPVVYWSGIVEVGPERKELTWNVPDYFNGNLRVMAVACQAERVGSAECATLVKAPIILQPNVPLFVSPGDEFEVSVSVLNHMDGPGAAPILVTAIPDGALEGLGAAPVNLTLESGRESSVRWRFRAKNKLGPAELRIEAVGGGATVRRSAPLSVRPASHYLSSVTTGWFRIASAQSKVTRELAPEFRHVEAIASAVPMGLARGLEAYVREFPYGCSEQITSRAMVKLVTATEADFGVPPAEAAEALRSAIQALTQRQRSDGGFGYWWADAAEDYQFHSLYVLHFLTEARALGHAVPDGMLERAVTYAQRTARAQTRNLKDAEMQAIAIYLIARNGNNPAPQLLNLRDTLATRFKGQWEPSASAAWMAATYMLLKQDGEANKLLETCLAARRKLGGAQRKVACDYYDTPMMEDLAVFYLQCRHFPERARKFGIDDLEPVMTPLRDQGFNTLACSYMTLALKAYSDLVRAGGLEVSILALPMDGAKSKLLAGPSSGIIRSAFDPGTAALKFERKQTGSGDHGVFYQVVEQGYDAGKPAGPERSGLEVLREILPVAKDRPLRPGDPVEVVLRLRNVTKRNLDNLAMVDLLPAGFEVLAGDLKSGARTVPGTSFCELREDRNLFFLGLAANAEWSVKYRMKAVSAGVFAVPAAMAEDMYDRGLHGLSAPGRIEVTPSP